MDPKQAAAAVIASSILAALRIALERGELVEANLEHIAGAAANNAAQQIAMLAELG